MADVTINEINTETVSVGSAYTFRNAINNNFNIIKNSINNEIKVKVDDIKENQEEVQDRVVNCAKTHVEAGITQATVTDHDEIYQVGDICLTW